MKATIFVCDEHLEKLGTVGVGDGHELKREPPHFLCAINVSRKIAPNQLTPCPNPPKWATSVSVITEDIILFLQAGLDAFDPDHVSYKVVEEIVREREKK